VLNAWYPTGSILRDDVVVFKRNPYYVGVDAEGNQLPYIDTMTHFHIPGDQERLNLMVLAGEMDFQAFGINNEDLPLFKQGEEDGGYRLIGHPVARGIWDGMYINFSLEGKMGDLLRNVDFRRALSVAIDRDAINQNSYLGLGEARQIVPLNASPFYPGDEAAFAWTQYDVDLANMMLDEILPDKDSDGFRTFPDGERVVLLLDAWNQINNSSSLQVPQYWEAVGMKTEYGGALGGEQGGTVIRDRVQQNENMFMMYVINAAHPFVQNSYTSPTAWWSFSGPAYGSYHCKCHPEDDPGMMPTGEMQELIDLHLRGTTVPESEQVELGKEIFRRWAEDVYGIGLVGNVPRYAAVKNGLRNVPTSWMGGATERSPSTAFLEQFYWAR
jgi:peptide/nickel transport system substrate-binding protein